MNQKKTKRMKRYQENHSHKNVEHHTQCNPPIDIKVEIINLLNDKMVQKDRVVRLAMLSILGLYSDGVSKKDITRLEVMNASYFMNVIENYRPKLAQRLHLHYDEWCLSADFFCESLKSMVRAMFLTCFIVHDDDTVTFDSEEFVTLRDTLQKDTLVSKGD